MPARITSAFLCVVVLSFVGKSFAQPLPMAVSANPNDETMELSYRDEFRVRVGTTIPIARTDGGLWVTLAGAVDIHDPSGSLFPAKFWRGLIRLSMDALVGDYRVGAHLFHESDHESVSEVGTLEYPDAPFLYLNAIGAHASRRWESGRLFVDAGAVVRMHLHTCTIRRQFVFVSDLDNACGTGNLGQYLGFEAHLHGAIGYGFGEYTSLFAALHGEFIVGGAEVGTERRLLIRAGATFHTTHGDWSLFGETLLGNEVGLFRERESASVGAGFRYTPPFAD